MFGGKKSEKMYNVYCTRLKLNRNSLNPISIPGYNIEYTPAESSNGGTLLYIKQV